MVLKCFYGAINGSRGIYIGYTLGFFNVENPAENDAITRPINWQGSTTTTNRADVSHCQLVNEFALFEFLETSDFFFRSIRKPLIIKLTLKSHYLKQIATFHAYDKITVALPLEEDFIVNLNKKVIANLICWRQNKTKSKQIAIALYLILNK